MSDAEHYREDWPEPRDDVDADKQGESDDETRRERLKQYVRDHPDEADGFDLGEAD